jgi:tetratricopeptide (TPR) repeat protein
MRLLFRSALGCLAVASALFSLRSVRAQSVGGEYRRFFVQRADQRSRFEKALNLIGRTSFPVGRSFALIAGVTQYPNFPQLERSLRPAAIDIEKLQAYLKEQEFFDEIVVLKDADMTLPNLNYFLESYFPERLAQSPHSRFLFAYSGHGYSVKTGLTTVRGYLLTSSATTLTDPQNTLDLSVLRTILGPVIDSAEKVLVLVNSCDSGAFLGRKGFGPNPLGPGEKGAHAIMASRPKQPSLHLDNVGPGSVFFEKIFAALGGAADMAPADGVVTYHELDTYLHAEIPYATNGDQNPVEGDISPDGSVGEFFFLNRSRQLSFGNTPRWNPENVVAFGPPAEDVLKKAREAFRAEENAEAVEELLTQAAEAGNTEAMNDLGYMYAFAGTQNFEKARQLWEKAATEGNTDAMCNLGYAYNHDNYGIRRDYSEARQWYEKAAAAGHAEAVYRLGQLYLEEDDSEHRMKGGKEARRWYERAAVAGDSRAMYALGGMCAEGLGGPQDYQQARQWFEKAAAMGHRDAMYDLADMYEKGQGGPQDPQKAQQWRAKAQTASLPRAYVFITHDFGP